MRFPRARFQSLAEKALGELPRRLRALLYNVGIDIKEKPGAEAGKWKGSSTLLGLYSGLKRSEMASPVSGTYLPARIVLYKKNIEDRCASEKELARMIRHTLFHEIGHHLGFGEDEIRKKWPDQSNRQSSPADA
ncbi:MAG: metallopeptidase family protein [Elusimicrobia bacterium]|nr:metallopeptidase family protein [Elusimicrobiota bacterium]